MEPLSTSLAEPAIIAGAVVRSEHLWLTTRHLDDRSELDLHTIVPGSSRLLAPVNMVPELPATIRTDPVPVETSLLGAAEGPGPARHFAFVGSRGFADFYGVGGMQSYVRRLGTELAARGNRVDFLVHQAPHEAETAPAKGLRVRYFVSLADSLAALSTGGYSDVVRVWFASRERLDFMRYVMAQRSKSPRVHYMWFVVPESPARRIAGFLEGVALSRRGVLFCVSPRQWRTARRWTGHARLLLPPVPRTFFLKPEDKPLRWPLRITYIGVLNPDKGVDDVVQVFSALQGDSRFLCSLNATHDPTDAAQVAMHRRLLQNDAIRYVPVAPGSWSQELESHVRTVLADTDVFIQPFQSLQNTVDTPLLMLEAMASLCAVLTTPLHSIPELYQGREFLLPREGFAEQAIRLLQGLTPEALSRERERVFRRNQELRFSQEDVADSFLAVGDSRDETLSR